MATSGYNLGTARGKVEIDSSDVQNASNDLKNADIVLRQSGQSLLQFGQQALQAFGYVVGIGAQFEKEMDFVQAVTNGTDEDMARLKETAIELGKSGAFGPIELSKAFVELAKAGITADDIVNGVGKSVTDLASAAQITTTAAGEIAVQTMATFGLVAEEVPRAVDLIAGAANASMIDVQDFSTTLKYVGPVAAALGVDLEDLSTTIAVLGNSGIRGSTAGTSLRQTLLNLSGATPKARDAMKELGIITEDGANIFYDASGQLKDLTTIFDTLGQKLQGLTDRQKADALRDIFGVRQLPTVLYLMEQGRASFEEFNAAINEVTAAEVAEKRLDNLSGAITRFKATLESVLLGPSGSFQNMLKEIVQGATQLLLWFDALPGPIKTFLVGSIGVVGVLSLMSGAFLLTVGNMVRAVRVFGELGTVATRLPGLLSAIASGARAVALSFAANPYVLAAAAIALLAYGLYQLYQRWDAFHNLVDRTWQNIQAAWDGITEGFVNLWHAAQDFFHNWTGAWNSFQNAFSNQGITTGLDSIHGWIERIGNAMGDAWRASGEFFRNLASGAAELGSALGSGLTRGLNAMIEFFTALPGIIGRSVVSAFQDAISTIGKFVADSPRLIGYAIGFIIGRFIRLHLEVAKAMLKFGRVVVTTLIDLVKFAGPAAVRIADAIITGFLNFVTSLPGRLWGILVELVKMLIDIIPQAQQASFEIGTSIFTGILDAIIALPGFVWNIFSEVIGFLWMLLREGGSLAWQIGTALVNGIISVITGLPGLVWDILTNVIGAFTDLISFGFNAAKNFAKGLWEGFKDGLGINSPSFIEEALFNIQGEAKNTDQMLSRHVKSMGLTGTQIPNINSTAVGLPTPAMQAAAGTAGTTFNAPLVGQATIRDERDIVTLARELDKERALRERGKGRQVMAGAAV